MTNKLYVANVPLDATEDALRVHFASCGGVLDVEILRDRQSGRSRGLANVTMTSESFAATAVARLDGVAFGGSVLRVSDAPIRGDSKPRPSVKIVLQFRDRTSMTYDLDCAGTPLTLIMSVDPPETVRIEARSARDTDGVVGVGHGPTRREALVEALRAWNAASSAASGGIVDADAIAHAMLDVKAI